MSDDTQMHDPVDEQTEHPFQDPGRVLSEDDANDGRDLALQLNAKFERTKPKYVIKARDMPAIIKNPKAFPVNKTGFTSKRAQAVLKHHRVLAKHFLAHPSDEDQPQPLPQGQPNLQATRGETAKKRAHARDQFMCNVLKTFYSEMAHVIPFSLTGTTVAVEEMRECFLIMKTLISPRFYKMWLSCALTLGGFEKDYNLFALNPFINTLFDEGVIAFQPLHGHEDEEDDRFYATIQIHWMPVCTALTKAVAILDNGPNDVVARLFNEVETAFEQGFLPRLPAKGAGSLWICFKDGEQVKSGHTFDIEFPTELERDYYADLMGAHYEVMLLLTLQGKTKGFPPVVGDDDDDDGGDGKGKQRASSPGSPAVSVSSPARGPVAPPPPPPSLYPHPDPGFRFDCNANTFGFPLLRLHGILSGQTHAPKALRSILLVPIVRLSSSQYPVSGSGNVSAQVPTAGPSQPAGRGGAARGGAARGGAARGGAARGSSGNTGQ